MDYKQAFNELYEAIKQEGMSGEFSKELIVYKAEELKGKTETTREEETNEENQTTNLLKSLDDAKITGY